MKCAALLAALTLAFASDASSSDYTIDYDQSFVRFQGSHAGNDFVGEFENWTGTIRFDAQNLDAALLIAEFDLTSAVTGNKMYDGTLPTSDWFDIKKTPVATFESELIEAIDGNTFRASGALTLRGMTMPVAFDFTLEEAEDGVVRAYSELSLARLDFQIGEESDPSVDWVSNEIKIVMELTAERDL